MRSIPIFLLYSAVIVLLVHPVLILGNAFREHRLHVIDYNSTLNRFMFRGSFPKNDQGEFAYNEMVSTMKQRVKEEIGPQVTFPDHFELVDVTFLNYITEAKDIEFEQSFFEKNPSLGRVEHWTILGNLLNATKFPESVRKEMALDYHTWDVDKLEKLVDFLHSLLHNRQQQQQQQQQQDSPKHNMNTNATATVIYIHCEAGVDRTGEVSASYYMKWMHWSYSKALQYNYNVEPRPISSFSEHAMNWYCWYLYYTTGFPSDCTSWLPKQESRS